MAISKREAAKKIASKVKSKTKSKRNASVERYQSQGQGNPQSKAWTEPNDEGVAAKPVGWRWTNLGASKLGKNPDSRPSNADVKSYGSKSFKVKGETHRYLYTEKRVDKSDKNRSAKFYAGGTTGAGSFQDGGTVGAGSFKKGGATFGGRQYDPYSEDADGQKIAKPIGWRYTDKLAKRLGKNVHSRPTTDEVEKYAGRGVYYEARQDKSDAKPSKKFISLEDGGTTGAGSFADGGEVKKIVDGKDVWYLTYIDSTHFYLSNSKDFKGSAYHLAQFRGEPFYDEVKSWLKSQVKMEDGGTVGAGSFKDGGDVKQKGSQSGNPTRSLDKAQQAKPVGFRFRGNKYRRPSEQHIKQQLKLSPADRDIYFERRKDKSDYSFEARLENGGDIEGAGMFARGGGVERVANTQSRDYSENLIPFKGANLEGKTLDNGDYVVLSYGYYPIWWYCKAEGKWYGNSTKYSVTTSKQMTQSRPTYDAKMVTKNELTDLMMKHHARFEDGGMLDGILGDTGAATTNGVGGTSFSSLDLTSNMDLTNPAF